MPVMNSSTLNTVKSSPDLHQVNHGNTERTAAVLQSNFPSVYYYRVTDRLPVSLSVSILHCMQDGRQTLHVIFSRRRAAGLKSIHWKGRQSEEAPPVRNGVKGESGNDQWLFFLLMILYPWKMLAICACIPDNTLWNILYLSPSCTI